MSKTRWVLAKTAPIFIVAVVLPTPPFWFATVIILLIFPIVDLFGRYSKVFLIDYVHYVVVECTWWCFACNYDLLRHITSRGKLPGAHIAWWQDHRMRKNTERD